MNKETLRMQMLAGIITESEHNDILEEIDRDKEGKKFFVYTQHTPSGEWIGTGKKLAKNLTRDEVNVFVKNNQSKYKFPLAWSEDRGEEYAEELD
jgi:hypothetical protein